MSAPIIVTTPDELRALVREAVAEAMAERSTSPAVAPLLSKQALAAQLSISVAGVDRLVRDGRIPFVRVGDVKRFDAVGVRTALENAPASPSRVSDAPVRLLRRGGADG